MIRRLVLALLLAAAPGLAQAQFAVIAPDTPNGDSTNRIVNTRSLQSTLATGLPLAAGTIYIGNGSNFAQSRAMTQDCTISQTGVLTCTQAAGNFTVIGTLAVGGLATFNASATVNGTLTVNGWIVDRYGGITINGAKQPTFGTAPLANQAGGLVYWSPFGGLKITTAPFPNMLLLSGFGGGAPTWTQRIPAGAFPILTGDVTTPGGSLATTIAANAVTNAKAAQMAANTFKGNNTGGTANAADLTIQQTVNALAAYQRNALAGCNTSGGGSTTLTINACVVTSDDNTTMMSLGSTYTKTFAGFAVGTGNGGLDTGAIAASTWYHVYIIQRPDTGVVDVLISLSATAPTLPANYTKQRRIASIKTDGGPNIVAYVQDGDYFQWSAAVLDIAAANPGTAAVTRTLTTPTNVRNRALITVGFGAATPATDNPAAILITDLSIPDVAPTVTNATIVDFAVSGNFFAPAEVWTSTSATVRSRIQISAAGTTLYILTRGWVDTRGQFN